jgi:alcohol dehydrogenase (NADP+)
MSLAKAFATQSASSPLLLTEIERREIGPSDVQIEILYCGVCHSDIHQARGEWGNSMYPMVPGHEIVGKITAIGSNITKFKIGDNGGVGCMVDSCRTCEQCHEYQEQNCEKGNTQTYNGKEQVSRSLTFGGYSSQIVVDERFVMKIGDNLNLAAIAPLLCAGITTYSPLRYVGVKKGDKVAVLGLGGLGHMAVKLANAMGAEVTMLSTSPSKQKDAERLGAHHFELITDPIRMKALRNSFNYIVNTVSVDHDVNMILGLLKVNGTMIMVGAPPTKMPIHAFSLIGGRKSIMGSNIGGTAETQEMLDFCAQHNIVSDIELIDIQDIENAYERMQKNDVRYRFVIDMASLK